jgi:ABC-type multidrug transport system fused ATPase/permease subunit
MIDYYKKIPLILSKREKILLLPLILLGFFSSLLEMFAIVMILPVFEIIFSGNMEKYINIINTYFYFPEFYEEKISKSFILVLVLIIFIIKNILLGIINYITTKYFFNINYRISNELFNKYLNSNYSFFITNKSEEFLRKVYHDTDAIKTYLISAQILFVEILFVLLLFLFLFITNREITIFIILIFLISFLIYSFLFKKKIMNLGKIFQDSIGGLQNVVINGVLGIKDIITYNMENWFSDQFKNLSKQTIFSQFKLVFLTSLPRFYLELIVVMSIIIPMIFFINFNLDIQKSLPIISLFAVSLFRMIPSANKILSSYNNIKFSKVFIDTYTSDLNKINHINKLKEQKLFDFQNILEFKNLKYTYSKSNIEILKNINLVIKKNQTTLITGPNGSGKSTLLNIISGLISITDGQILLDSKEIKLNRYWAKQLSYVQQNSFLLNKTIRENIVTDVHKDLNKIDKKKLKDIEETLNLNKVFENFPEKLDSNVGYNGEKLSGGQKQILSIARALYKDGKIIILDEPSSALDEESKNILVNLLLKIKNKKTIIIVSHELELFNNCTDTVLDVNNGMVKQKFLEKI